MANITVGAMPNTTSLAKTDLIHVVQSGVDKNSALQPLTTVLGTMTAAVAQAVSDSDTVTSLVMALSITCDASSAAVDFTLANPTLLGQFITVTSSGASYRTSFSGLGLYTNKIFVSDGLTATVKSVSDGSGGLTWSAVDGVTADYVDTGQRIERTSFGKQIISKEESVSGVNSFNVTYSESFVSLSKTNKELMTATNNILALSTPTSYTLTGIGYRFYTADTGNFHTLIAGSILVWSTEGKY